MNEGRPLEKLLTDSGLVPQIAANPEIQGLSYDSRRIRPGDLFFAIKGVHSDGHEHLEDARQRGAAAVVVERDVKTSLPVVQVNSVLGAMSKISDAFYGKPSEVLPIIGVTGTNGKTTTTFLIEDLLRTVGRTCGVMGTVNYRIGSEIWPAPNTTPMSADVHWFFRKCLDGGAAAGVMEVSSHALELNRVDTVRFAVGVFTNLTQDHLDFHGTMENYYLAKARLFKRREPVRAAINIDDSYGLRLANEVPEPLTYGFNEAAALHAGNARYDLNGIHFDLRFPSGNVYPVSTNLLGQHNISNCLSAAGALLLYGLGEEQIVKGLNAPHAVPGRLERVEAGQEFVVAVDYAHTHDALEQVLTTLRNTGPKNLFCVFGAGGDRDKTKRPKMGIVAAKLADRIFITSDNPRTENPDAILKDIEAGVVSIGKSNFEVIKDRTEAIFRAVKAAQPGDIILIAGKGHENYQIFGTEKVPFSDFDVARRAIGS